MRSPPGPLGELIFITPRDFLKATGAARLNTWLYDQGTITDFEDLGDAKVFAGATPNCAIWRFVRGDMSHRLPTAGAWRCPAAN
jgi:adenine-specific DNA-methyltransferase